MKIFFTSCLLTIATLVSGNPQLSVYGKSVTAANPMEAMERIAMAYCDYHGMPPTREEVDQYTAFAQDLLGLKDDDLRPVQRHGHVAIAMFKFNKALHDRFGGKVVVRTEDFVPISSKGYAVGQVFVPYAAEAILKFLESDDVVIHSPLILRQCRGILTIYEQEPTSFLAASEDRFAYSFWQPAPIAMVAFGQSVPWCDRPLHHHNFDEWGLIEKKESEFRDELETVAVAALLRHHGRYPSKEYIAKCIDWLENAPSLATILALEPTEGLSQEVVSEVQEEAKGYLADMVIEAEDGCALWEANRLVNEIYGGIVYVMDGPIIWDEILIDAGLSHLVPDEHTFTNIDISWAKLRRAFKEAEQAGDLTFYDPYARAVLLEGSVMIERTSESGTTQSKWCIEDDPEPGAHAVDAADVDFTPPWLRTL